MNELQVVLSYVMLVCFIGLLCCFVLLIRNRLVASCRKRAISTTGSIIYHMIRTGQRPDLKWEAIWFIYYDSKPSYEKMMYQLWKWKYEQFFPELAAYERRTHDQSTASTQVADHSG